VIACCGASPIVCRARDLRTGDSYGSLVFRRERKAELARSHQRRKQKESQTKMGEIRKRGAPTPGADRDNCRDSGTNGS